MEYFTVMWVTVLSGIMEDSTSGLIYASLDQCEAAIPAIVATIEGQYDYSVICEESDLASKSIRPKARPQP